MQAFSHFCTLLWNLGAVYAWEELGSIVWKASNTLYVLLMGIIHHDTGVIWVEKQQLSNNNWNNVGQEGKNRYPDKITGNILKYIIPWVWHQWRELLPYNWDPKCCFPWDNLDLLWYNLDILAMGYQLPVSQAMILSLPLTSLRFPPKASLTF